MLCVHVCYSRFTLLLGLICTNAGSWHVSTALILITALLNSQKAVVLLILS